MRRRWSVAGSGRRSTLVVGSLATFGALTWGAISADYFRWDLPLTLWIQSWDWAGLDTAMRAVSWLGTGWTPYWLVAAVCLSIWGLSRPWEAAVCSAGVGSGAIVNRLLKWLVDRPRPDESIVAVAIDYSSPSFPSGHVTLFVEFFGFLLFLIWIRRLPFGPAAAVGCAVLIVAVGPSRIFLGAHWPSDVLAGYLGGGLWLASMIWLYRTRDRD